MFRRKAFDPFLRGPEIYDPERNLIRPLVEDETWATYSEARHRQIILRIVGLIPIYVQILT